MKSALRLALFVLLVACDDSQPNTTTSPQTHATETPRSPFDVEIVAPASVEEGQVFALECVVARTDAAAASYAWVQNGLQPKASIPRDSAPRIEVRAPEWTADYDLVIQVSVAAGGELVEREATVRVSADDDAPQASFVAPANVECGELVSLIGQTQNEPLQETVVEWRQLGEGPRVNFDATTRHQAHFFAPEHDSAYTLEIEFRASDTGGPAVAKSARIEVTCDPDETPLPSGSTLVLPATAGLEHALPRGVWELEGSVFPSESAASTGFEVRLRFASGDLCAALMFTGDAEGAALATAGLSRTAEGAWEIPKFKSGMPLGPWPKDVPLGFVCASDGREVSVRFGPAGAKDQWPELPFDIVLPIGKRPKVFALDVVAGDVKLGDLMLRAP